MTILKPGAIITAYFVGISEDDFFLLCEDST